MHRPGRSAVPAFRLGALAVWWSVAGGCDGRGGNGGPDVDACSGATFTPIPVVEGTPGVDGAATPEQLAALTITNDLRRAAGALPLNLDAAIDAAAAAHARYYVDNPQAYAGGLSPHQEDPGYPGFTGVDFWDRMAAAGYAGGPAFEVMAFAADPALAVAQWLNSVYHRTPFLAPANLDLGYGGATGAGGAADVIDFGCCSAVAASDSTILYPYHDQTDVPAAFDGNEGPPPPAPPGGWPSGSPVTIHFHSSAVWTVGEHVLYDDACATIAHRVSAGPDADPDFQAALLPGTFLMLPDAPLRAAATYTVLVEGTLDGMPFVRAWRFATAP